MWFPAALTALAERLPAMEVGDLAAQLPKKLGSLFRRPAARAWPEEHISPVNSPILRLPEVSTRRLVPSLPFRSSAGRELFSRDIGLPQDARQCSDLQVAVMDWDRDLDGTVRVLKYVMAPGHPRQPPSMPLKDAEKLLGLGCRKPASQAAIATLWCCTFGNGSPRSR